MNFMDSVVQSSGSNDIFFLRLTSDGHVGTSDPVPSLGNGAQALILSPEQGLIVVRLDPQEAEYPARLEIIDLCGKCIFSQALVASDTRLQLDLPPGGYLARVTMGGTLGCYRFMAM